MYRVLVVGEASTPLPSSLLGSFSMTNAPHELEMVLRAMFASQPHALVLDCSHNGKSRQLFRFLRAVCDEPLLVIGGDTPAEDIAWYLENGASGYLCKPVTPAHLAAKLKAALRRAAPPSNEDIIRAGELEVDSARHEVRYEDRIVDLTPTEFRLLKVLAEHADRACSQRMLLDSVWGAEFVQSPHYLRLYIGYLRQKLEADPRNPTLLTTEWGIGYRLRSRNGSNAPRQLELRTA